MIIVEDDGIGMDPARLTEDLDDAHLSGAHVGLGNVDDRMRSTFGDDFGLVVDTARRRRHEDHPARPEVPGRHPRLSRSCRPGARSRHRVRSDTVGHTSTVACARTVSAWHGCLRLPDGWLPGCPGGSGSGDGRWCRWSGCTG